MQRNIARDTLLLTIIQMSLDGIGLLLNAWMTGALGAEAIGMLSLTGSFFGLASVMASGNAFLCASRFVSEELGKPGGNPGRVLRYCMGVALLLSCIVGLTIALCAPLCSAYFFGNDGLASPIRLMALSLPLLSVTACMRGYFNAACHAGICAASDAIGFLVRCVLMLGIVRVITPVSGSAICMMTALCTIGGSAVTLLFLLWKFRKHRTRAQGNASITLRQYGKLAVPVMFGSALTSVLSSANDALVPLTLRQAGNSAGEALSQFGIFEAIVIPTLFFPSTVLCSLSGILVTETAREAAACNKIRITALSEKILARTILFAVYITAVFLVFGKDLGALLGGEDIGGRMISLLAPVVPFIYLEIVLESIIKGLGAQAFSSLNYLAEYVIRISVVLVCVPLFGFYGIVLSYYASNVCGNIARLCMVIRKTDIRPDWLRVALLPAGAAFFAYEVLRVGFAAAGISPHGAPAAMGVFVVLYALLYLGVYQLVCGPGASGKRRGVLAK